MSDRWFRVRTAYRRGGSMRLTRASEVRYSHLCSAVLKATRVKGFDHVEVTEIDPSDRECVARAGGKDQ